MFQSVYGTPAKTDFSLPCKLARMWHGKGVLVVCSLLAASGTRSVEVSNPYYLDYIEDPFAIELRRCESQGLSCASVNGLPRVQAYEAGPHVVAAGANRHFVVVAYGVGDRSGDPRSYYYFARVPEEKKGWGANPEKIVGPLDERDFKEESRRIGLPELTVSAASL